MAWQRRLVLCGLMLVGACRGCADDDVAPPKVAEQPRELARKAQIQKRFAQRKINLKAEYPRDKKGRYKCGKQLDCLVVAAHRCKPAVVEHEQTMTRYGLKQTVRARYEVLGELTPDGETCGLARKALDHRVTLEPGVPDALAKQGKSAEEIESFRLDAEAMLGNRNPQWLYCKLDRLSTLEVALDLVEGRYDPAHWRGRCETMRPPQDEDAGAE